MNRERSRVRLYSMRLLYLFNGIVIGIGAWPEIIHSEKPWDLIHSVAFSLYAAYSLLMLLGVQLPIRMLPLLLLQLLYKVIWLIGGTHPLWSTGHLNLVSGTMTFFAVVVVLDLIIIPWPFVFQNDLRAAFRGEGKLESLNGGVSR